MTGCNSHVVQVLLLVLLSTLDLEVNNDQRDPYPTSSSTISSFQASRRRSISGTHAAAGQQYIPGPVLKSRFR